MSEWYTERLLQELDCFIRPDYSVKPGFADPGDHLKRCGEAIAALRKDATEREESIRTQISRARQSEERCEVLLKLQSAVQTETEKALVRRVGELQAELLELRTTRKELDLLFDTPSARRED